MRDKTGSARDGLPIHRGEVFGIRLHDGAFQDLDLAILADIMSFHFTPHSSLTRRLTLITVALAALTSACGSAGDTESDSSTIDSVAPTTTAPPSNSTEPTNSEPAAGVDMRGLRYCEILFLNMSETGLVAEVYNTYPLNDCPPDQWQSLDMAAIAVEAGVPLALANGPRFWLMNTVAKPDRSEIVTKDFGGISMNRYARVEIGKPDTVGQPYSPQAVDRRSSFTFYGGQTVYTLIATDGTEYIMQSWSQQSDATLTEDALANLGTRLQLPEGWQFVSRVLSEDLIVDTTETVAYVLQDEFMNSYSRLA